MYCSRAAVPGPSAMAPVRLFRAEAASGVSFTKSHTSGTKVCAWTSTTVTRRPAIIARRRAPAAPCAKVSAPTARPAAAPATVFKKSRRFGIALPLATRPASELKLHPQSHQTSTEDLRDVLPDSSRRAVGRVHVEHIARIQQVVDIYVSAQLAGTELKEPREAQVHLLQARFEHGVRRDQLDRHVAVAGRCATRSEEHTSELQSRLHLVCRLLVEKKTAGKSACAASDTHARLQAAFS